MKGEYSLNVAIPIKSAVKRVMEMPGSSDSEGISFSGRIKQVSKKTHICLSQVSESEIKFSDSIGWPVGNVLTGDCIFNSVSKNNTQVTAKFKMGISSIKTWKAAVWILLVFIPVAAWFLYEFMLDSGTPERIALKITVLASLILTIIGPILIGFELWQTSGKIKIFLANFSNALGVGNDWT